MIMYMYWVFYFGIKGLLDGVFVVLFLIFFKEMVIFIVCEDIDLFYDFLLIL